MRRAVVATVAAVALAAPGHGPLTQATGKQRPHHTEASRARTSLNEGWEFRLDGASGGSWTSVDLPHTWNDEDAFDEEPGYHRGFGVFRRNIRIPESTRPRRYFLYFEGANQVAEVYVNGDFVGSHAGGYTAFAFDVTELLLVDEANDLEVVVDNSHHPDIPPLEADFTFYGGIYRDVWLVSTDNLHIDVLDHAGPGVYVATPRVEAQEATVEVRALIRNDARDRADAVAVVSLSDSDGQLIARDSVAVVVNAGLTFEVTRSFDLTGARLWSPETPDLYRADVALLRDGVATDDVSVNFGIRSVLVDGDGFYLNGKPYRLTGTNRHQDRAGFGNALPDSLHARDVQTIKSTGFNFLRLAHYPQDPAVLQETDRLGLAVWEEIPVVNTVTVDDAFAANAERMLTEMIRQHYNHPSIVIWGLMNEALLRFPDPVPAGYRDSVAALANRLQRVALREDPSRATALAVSFHEVFDGSGVSEAADILGMNLYFGWYYGRFEDLGPYLDSLHAAHPGTPLFISEYGAGSDERIHSSNPSAFDFSTEHALAFHRTSYEQIREREYLAGTAVWNQFDFGSNHRQDTKDALNQKGLFYFDRTPKDLARFYSANLTPEPVIAIERDNLIRAGWEASDRTQTVTVFSNADSVSISVNGVDVPPTMTPQHGVAVFNVVFSPGHNDVTASGRRDGSPERVDRASFQYTEVAACTARCSYGVNVGARHSFVDAEGVTYLPDPRPDSTFGRTHRRVAGTVEDARFQSYREWPAAGSVHVPVPAPGRYDVTLGFIEPGSAQAGERVFAVLVAGRVVLDGVDVAAEVGSMRALEKRVSIEVPVGRDGVTVELRPAAGRPVLSTVRLENGSS